MITRMLGVAGLLLGLALPEARADATLARIDSLWNSGERAASEAGIEAALGALHPDSAGLRAPLLMRRGAHGVARGQFIRAESDLRAARRAAAARGDSALLAPTLRWLSLAISQQGRAEEARPLYHELLGLADARRDDYHGGWARVGLAWDSFQAGRLEEAEDHYRESAARLGRAGDRGGRLWALNGLGMTQSALGRYRAASETYARVVALSAEFGNITTEALAANNLGHLDYSLGDPGSALAAFRRARSLHERAGNRRAAVIPRLNIALCEQDLGFDATAAAVLDSCLEQCRREGYPTELGMALERLATLEAGRARPEEAIALYREALGGELGVDRRVMLRCSTGLVDCLAELGRYREAEVAVARAAALMDAGTTSIEALGLRIESGELALLRDRNGEALSILAGCARAAEAAGLDGIALRAYPRAAAAAGALGLADSSLVLLRAGVEAWERDRSLPLDPIWRERRAAAGRRIFTELAFAQLTAGETRKAYALLQRFKARTLHERIAGPGAAPISARPAAELRLAPGELLIDFYLGPTRSLVFLMEADSLHWRELPGEEALGARIRRLHRLLTAPARGFESTLPAGLGGAFAEYLFGPLTGVVEAADRIHVAPDGVVHLLSFPALFEREAARPSRRWSRVPSLAVLSDLRGREKHAPEGGTRSLAVAGVDGEALPGVAAEVKELSARYQGVLALLPAAGAEGVDAASLGGFDVLHLASHVRGVDGAPWQSALELPDSAGGSRRLEAAEILTATIPARLVVLPDCGSGSGPIQSGEGIQGLGSAFLAAGAHAALVTLWPVDDAVCVHFTRRFYAELERGASAAAALARARDVLRSRPETAHPGHWAAFSLLGDDAVRLQLDRKFSPWPVLLIGLGLALGLASLLVRRLPVSSS